MTILDLAQKAKALIDRARDAGVVIDAGNVRDLLADNTDASLEDIGAALATLGPGYPKPKVIQGWDRLDPRFQYPVIG